MSKYQETEKSRLSPKVLTSIIIAIVFGIALCLRICLPYDQVFSAEGIKFTSVDAYYHMRLIDNLVHNFPHLISIDPYLLFPGTAAMGPTHLFDRLLAGIILMIGQGSPTQHTINVVAVYFPAILGALTVIPVYFIGKELFNRWAGVISAFLIALMPGEFIGRSILGFTDYDVAGTLVTTATMLFMILAIKAARQRKLNFSHLRHRDRAVIAKPIIYSVLAGIFLGIYLFTWPGALLFVLTIFLYFVIQFIIDHLKHHSTDYLCLIGVILFLVATVMFAPASGPGVASASLVIALIIPLLSSGISRLFTHRQIKPAYYPLTIVGLGAIGVAIFRVISPSFFSSMIQTLGILVPKGDPVTTLEMQPLTAELAWNNFTTGFILGIIALVILIYLNLRKNNAERSLLIVWSLAILVITLMQRRFAGYLAINIALLTGYLSTIIFFAIRQAIAYFRNEPGNYLSYESLKSPDVGKLIATPAGTMPKREERKKDKSKRRHRDTRTAIQHPSMIAAGVIIFLLVILPNIPKAVEVAREARFAPGDGWCQALNWLKANTSDPFGDPDFYYELSSDYPPPTPDYCVTAWWDYGYWITRIAHRVPNTNPAQGGAGEVANLLLSTDEETADAIRGRTKSTYLIIDYDTITSKYWAIATWVEKDPNQFFEVYYRQQEDKLAPIIIYYPEYYSTLATRLYNFDGKAITSPNPLAISYQERIGPNGELIKEITGFESFSSYEEAEAYVSSQNSANYRIASDSPFVSPIPLDEVLSYQLVYSSEVNTMQPRVGMVPSIKIFKHLGDG